MSRGASASRRQHGTTQKGGSSNDGTVFSLAPPTSPGGSWGEKVLHSFRGTDGAEPLAGLVIVSDRCCMEQRPKAGPDRV